MTQTTPSSPMYAKSIKVVGAQSLKELKANCDKYKSLGWQPSGDVISMTKKGKPYFQQCLKYIP